MNDSALEGASPLPLIHGLEDRVPPLQAVLVSVQQVGAMVVGTITPALILAGILGFTQQQTAYLVSMAFLGSALGTFLQTMRFGIVGCGLLSVTGTSFAFLGPLVDAGKLGGLALMAGMGLAGVVTQFALAPILPKLRRVFTPLVSGIVVLLIGISLIPTGFMGIAKAPVAGAPVWGGAVIAMGVVAVMMIAQMSGRPWLRMGAVLAGVAVGYIACACLGWLRAPESGVSWITLPRIFPYGVAFNAALFLPFAFIYLLVVIEGLGDMTATSQLSGLKTDGPEFWKRMRGGILADGIVCATSSLCGAFPSSTYAQNNGVIQMTGVASRRIGWMMALLLLVLGLVPAVGRWVTVMPSCVLGALAVLLFGLVGISGVRLIMADGLPQRDALITAISLGVGLGASSQPEWLHSLPHAVQTFLHSGISAGGMTALVLNLVIP